MLSLFRSSLTMGLLAVSLSAQAGNVLISEIFFNPPGANDSPATNSLEYIELCGEPNATLEDMFLVFLENENDEFNSQNPGEIENIFNLGQMSLGSNGFLVLAQKNSAYPALVAAPFVIPAPAVPAQPTVAESRKVLPNGANVYQNRDTGNGYGTGATSSIAHVGQNTDIEGSGFTAMLIKVLPSLGGVAPVLNADLDLGNDGLELPAGWLVFDSIGVFGESDEPGFGRLYSQNGFGPGTADPTGPGGLEPGADYVDTTAELLEIEYVARVNTGDTVDSWVAINLTNNAATGFTNALRNYAVSGDHTNLNDAEVYVGHTAQPTSFPYGTDITVTFGSENVNWDGTHVPEANGLILVGIGLASAVGFRLRRRKTVTG